MKQTCCTSVTSGHIRDKICLHYGINMYNIGISKFAAGISIESRLPILGFRAGGRGIPEKLKIKSLNF